jgi:hypothetical protein
VDAAQQVNSKGLENVSFIFEMLHVFMWYLRKNYGKSAFTSDNIGKAF